MSGGSRSGERGQICLAQGWSLCGEAPVWFEGRHHRYKTRRLRVRARALMMKLGMEPVDAYQVAGSVEWLREDAAGIADAIAAADALALELAIGNCLTHAALLGAAAEWLQQQGAEARPPGTAARASKTN
jgi:hypothetical protein